MKLATFRIAGVMDWGVAALLVAVARPTAAQSADVIVAQITRQNPQCSVSNPVESFRGPLPGAAAPVVVLATWCRDRAVVLMRWVP